jgi:hypothetical protein
MYIFLDEVKSAIVIITNRKKYEMEIDLTCPHCSNDYHNDNPPRLLACGHTFCHNCLHSLLTKTTDSSTLSCPEDQQSVTISSSLDQLPKNLALMKLI